MKPTRTLRGKCPGSAHRAPLRLALTLLVGLAWLPFGAGRGAASGERRGSAALAPLSDEVARAFSAIRPDPPPPSLTAGKHFLVSDERAHHVFRDAIAGSGGLLLGVGTDQNYVMAGWARPEVLVLLDYDQMVDDLHRVYRVLFLHAPTAERFRALWSGAQAGEVERLLRRDYAGAPRREGIVRAYRRGRAAVERRLRVIARTTGRAGVATFLDDPAQYAFLRALFRANRVFSVRGDLTASLAMADVARAARLGAIPVRVLYLSNAERYFRYDDAFRANIRRLALDERTVVLRTAGPGARRLSRADGHYTYFLQRGTDFLAWLAHAKGRSVHRILPTAEPVPNVEGLYTLGPPPAGGE